MRRLLNLAIALLVLGNTALQADLNYSPWDLSPWFTRTFEFQPRLQYRGQSYPHVATEQGDEHYHSHDNFVDLALEISPWIGWSGAVAFSTLRTHQHTFNAEDAEFIIRYQLLDDVLGDAVSAVIGIRAIHTFKSARRDLGVFNRGGPSGEVHLAVGHECSQESQWLARIWGLVAYGIADVGSPWWRSTLTAEANYCDHYHSALFLVANGGWGSRALHPHHFQGYGPVDYTAIDLGGRLRCYLEDGSDLSLSYLYRIVARNAPRQVNQVIVAYTYPFGL